MTIRRIHIASFGPLRDFDCELYSGLNLIRGDNESGKTSLAMFIKFIFYGLSGRGSDSAPSERKKYINWDTGTADGYLIAAADGREYRLERSLAVTFVPGGKESVRETLTVTDTATGGRVHELEECPGAVLFGVPEQIFVNTIFAGQQNGSRIDGTNTAVAVENLLFSADETVSVRTAAERIDKRRRTLLHKNGGGGEIPALRDKCAELKTRLDEASVHSAELIELENAVEIHSRAERELTAAIEWQTGALRYYDAECLCRAGAEAKKADNAAAEAEAELRQALSLCCEPSKLDEARRLAASIEGERSGAAEFGDRLRELEVGAAALSDPDAPADPAAVLGEFRSADSAAGKLTGSAAVSLILGVLAGAGAAALYAVKSQLFLIALAGAAVLFILGGLFFILRGRKVSRMREICAIFGADDEDGLESAIRLVLSHRDEADILSRRADSVRLSLEQSGERSETLEAEAKALAASFEDCCRADERPADGTDTLDRLRNAIALAEKRQSAAESARGAYETSLAVAAEKWSHISKDKLAAAAEHLRNAVREEGYPTDNASADKLRQEMAFNQAKLDALRKKLHSLEVDLAAKRAVAGSPAELYEELADAKNRLRNMTLEHDAAVLAAETLAEAGENMRRGIIPRIVRRASALFTEATAGRYEALGSGAAFNLSAVIGGHTRDAALLSSGTEDLAYVCLRLSLAAELFGDKRPPLVFDESLAHMDPGRASAAKDILHTCGHQVLLFTCNEADPTLRMTRA